MTPKDLFSGHAGLYASFRPTYPEELYQFIFGHVKNKEAAWDCGTGNGQVARRLALDFEKVYATDLSEEQVDRAVRLPNIFYTVSPAEKTPFEPHSFDLVTVGQALHWFNLDDFYGEVRRVARPHAVVAAWGYGNIIINAEIDPIIRHFYSEVVGKYWDEARRHVETEYQHIPFPFHQITSPPFFIQLRWTLAHLCGYLESWSATQRFILDKKVNPVREFAPALQQQWGAEEAVPVRFPVFLKIGRIQG